MSQKIIKVNDGSAGVIIPRKELKKHGLKIGDEVKTTLADRGQAKAKNIVEYDPFIAKYGQALKNLKESSGSTATKPI